MFNHAESQMQSLEFHLDAMRKIMSDLAEAFDEALLLLEHDADVASAPAASPDANPGAGLPDVTADQAEGHCPPR
jgi:hypothetical protein